MWWWGCVDGLKSCVFCAAHDHVWAQLLQSVYRGVARACMFRV